MLAEIADELADALNTAGVNTTTDIRNLRPPGAVIGPPRVRVIRGPNMLVEATWTVTVAAPGPGNLDALNALLTLAETATRTINVTDWTPTVLTVGGGELPALDLTVITTVRDD